MKDEYFCPNCNAVLNDQDGFDPDLGAWTCTECGETLYGDDVENTMDQFDGVVWYCDECNAVLNTQRGFNDSCGTWCCTKCGHENTISEDEIYESEADYENRNKHKCPECGDILEDQYSFYEYEDTHTCTNCDTELLREDDEYKVLYRCPKCDEILNKQNGFYDYLYDWECDDCGAKLVKEYDGYHIVDEGENDNENSNKHRCPKCGDILEDQYSFYEYEDTHTCTNCDTELFKEDDEYKVLYRCPKCNEILNEQIGFDDDYYEWDCDNCGTTLEKEYDGYHIENEDDEDYNYVPSEQRTYTVHRRIENQRSLLDAEEIISKEKESRKREKRISFYKKHWRGLLILIAVACIGCFGGYKYYLYQRSIPVGVSSEELLGQKYESAVSVLEKAGFTDVSTSPEFDIGIEDKNIEGTVESVTIDGQNSFNEDKRFQFDAPVIVSYHKIKDIYVPLSAKEAKKLQYDDLVDQLKSAGFVNITLEPEYDLIKGWLKKEGRVESMTINGDSSFKSNAAYRPDAEIIIVYHAFKKDRKN